jgi:DNA-binding transcriptional LysR family regulator
MPAFLDCHPDVKVELMTNDAFVDLVGEGLDLAIRGRLRDVSARHDE